MGNELDIRDLQIRAPDGRTLLDIPALSVARGETVWLSGASGLGKSTLLKALAGLWPQADGSVTLPVGKLVFMPQQVYMPLGSLHDAAVYPADPESIPAATTERLLRAVGLSARLDVGDDNAGGLSVGEQQRLAIVRLIIAKPDWVFADEATSALDLETERSIMSLLRSELPQATIILIAHRSPQGLDEIRQVILRESNSAESDEAAWTPQFNVG